ncbi:MAG: TIGR04283 family arsenosugar biosynthesis glycosyltransferase [Nitrospiria bacterium]
MKISIIIPTLNEGKILRGTLKRLKKGMDIEIIVVDGGSTDDTVTIAKEFTKKVLNSPPGRARQMNEGAQNAEGEILLFLHADSRITHGGLGKVVPAIIGTPAVGGAFQLGIDSRNLFLWLIAWFANLRTRVTKLPYGDQGIFITRAIFHKIGGFPDIPVMEDVALAKKMKREGKIAFLKEKVLTSPRRWKQEGIVWTTVRNQGLMTAYLLGVSPQKLAGCYHNIR